jgi:hypothetical protein
MSVSREDLEAVLRRGLRSGSGGCLHHISTTRDGQSGVITVSHGRLNLAADLVKYTDVLVSESVCITLPR